MKKQRLVIVGNGMAGMKVVEEILANPENHYSITVFGAEPYGNYNRIQLSPVLSGDKTIDEIMVHDRDWYRHNQITLHAGPDKQVRQIDRKNRRVISRDGTVAEYDRLVIATGSRPLYLSIRGNRLNGVMAFRDIADVQQMLTRSITQGPAVVLGGGLLGLEAACGLASRGMQVTVIHRAPFLMNRQLDETAAKMLQQTLEARGIEFRLNAETHALIGDDQSKVKSVTLADGETIPCELFVMAIGIQPNIELARESGIHCDRGIIVNDTLQTFDPRIYAVGECVQHREETFGLLAPLFDQARVCANHLCRHGVASYVTLPTATRLKVSGIQLFSVGEYLEAEDCEVLTFVDAAAACYKKLVLRGSRLVGAILFGDVSNGSWYQDLIESASPVTDIRQGLLFGRACAEHIQDNQPQPDSKPADESAAIRREVA